MGPIGVLCIRRTLAHGQLTGFISGLGAASADATYGAVAALGLTALSDFLLSGQQLLSLLGGAFLLYLGVRTLLTPPSAPPAAPPAQNAGVAREARGLLGAYLSTFALTITNPVTILAFLAIFTGTGVSTSGGSVVLVLGVFCGSALWWLLLSGGVSLLRERFRPGGRWMLWINRLSGTIITGFGLLALFNALPG